MHSLRYAPSVRFNALMQHTGHTSDTFKFHVQKLLKLGYIAKLDSSGYALTTSGKEFANVLDESDGRPKKQPKLSVLIVAARQEPTGGRQFLLQQRLRNPYYGFWNEITDAVRWGESFEQAAARVLLRQTGLGADFTVRGMRRIRDYGSTPRGLLEDKLFVIVEATNIRGEQHNEYAGGTNAWLTLEELRRQEKYFPSTLEIIESLQSGQFYAARDLQYTPEEY